MTSARFALLIGNTTYADPKLSKLQAPAGDVRELSQVLASPDIGRFEVEVLLDRPHGEVMEAVARLFTDRGRDDLLLLYISGHGVLDEQRQLFFATPDTKTKLLSATALGASWVRYEMEKCRSIRQVVVLDCCHSGAFTERTKAALGQSVDTETALGAGGSGRVVLTATDATRYAFEGERILGEPEGSAFTRLIVEGLRTGDADSDGDGQVTIDELYDYVATRMRAVSPNQTPRRWIANQDGRLVLASNPAPRAHPDQIPQTLRDDAGSLEVHRRQGAVLGLKGWAARADHPGAARAAIEILERLVRDDDSSTVRAEAKRALDELTPAPRQAPAPEATKPDRPRVRGTPRTTKPKADPKAPSKPEPKAEPKADRRDESPSASARSASKPSAPAFAPGARVGSALGAIPVILFVAYQVYNVVHKNMAVSLPSPPHAAIVKDGGVAPLDANTAPQGAHGFKLDPSKYSVGPAIPIPPKAEPASPEIAPQFRTEALKPKEVLKGPSTSNRTTNTRAGTTAEPVQAKTAPANPGKVNLAKSIAFRMGLLPTLKDLGDSPDLGDARGLAELSEKVFDCVHAVFTDSVRVAATISKDGHVDDVKIVSGLLKAQEKACVISAVSKAHMQAGEYPTVFQHDFKRPKRQ